MTEAAAGPGLLDLLRVAGGLVFVIGLALGAALLFRRSGLRLGRGRELHVTERLSLARGVQLAVVTCGPRRLLLGVSDRRVELVTELDPHERPASAIDPDESPALASVAEPRALPPLAAFGAALTDALARRAPAATGRKSA